MAERHLPLRPGALLGGLALAATLAATLGACGDEAPATDPAAAVPTTPLWNPCDGLSAEGVSEVLGTVVTMDAGRPAVPRCAFTPAEEGGAAIDANYVLFPAGLDEAWDTMGELDGTVTNPTIARADDARVVVNVDDGSLLVTGFVQNDDLIQVVNLVDPAPYDRVVALRAVRQVMTDLSAHADGSAFGG
ncbi:hypothetical protein NPS01_11000 [Nocardioides psychrotolerans]|uniref:DUF3558 domain-containing protein n=1 Tax=Nocardioides psychrotolerans TaxID=1005945 RepID=A0A1I3EBP3_9ACTN|nr:hypothetical protein [Nocardioides psychrotolerans]GEP37437.1 hypothetical protein NPS01_11000 [Nocardioides psychrotolerans]SFH96338.1 hypothetical protein SAMN05216561_103291 [Nocardioides psychrotolerans]